MALIEALGLARAGRYAESLKVLDGCVLPTADRTSSEVLKVELLERLGRYDRCRSLGERLLRTGGLSSAHQSAVQYALGMIDWDDGRSEDALDHFQRSLKLADTANDGFQSCWAQLRLMLSTCGRLSAAAAGPLV